MTIKAFVKDAEAVLLAGRSADRGILSQAVRAMDECREPDQYRSASSLLAAWYAARLLTESEVADPETPGLLRAELTAFVILTGNPFVKALGEMYWIWGIGCDESEWKEPGTNPEFGGMSDRDCLLAGFRENAERVLPVIELARKWKLQHQDIGGLLVAERIIRRISRTNDATAADNEWLDECLPPAYNHLQELVQQHEMRWTPDLGARGRDRTTSHLMRWTAPWLLTANRRRGGYLHESEEVGGLVQVLSAVLAAEKGKHFDFVGTILVALRHWEMPILGAWVARQLGVALCAGPEQYAAIIASLPKKLGSGVMRKPDRHPNLGLSRRRELAKWYRSSEGQTLRNRLRGLFKVARHCAKALGKHRESLGLTEAEIQRLPADDRQRWMEEVQELEDGLGGRLQEILNMGSPRFAAHAIWLAEHGVLSKPWMRDDVELHIRYKYRA